MVGEGEGLGEGWKMGGKHNSEKRERKLRYGVEDKEKEKERACYPHFKP